MTDYYPLIARAVAGLEKNTGEARRALYERARTALVSQLRGLDPPLGESEITRERLALEEAIRKVETETARRARTEPTRSPDAAPVSGPPPRRESPKPDDGGRESPKPDKGSGEPAARPAEDQAAVPAARNDGQDDKPPVKIDEPPPVQGPPPAWARGNDRDRAGEAFDDVPDSRPLRHPDHQGPTEAGPGEEPRPNRRIRSRAGQKPIGARRGVLADPEEEAPRSRRGLIAVAVTLLVILALVGTAFWQRDEIASLFGAGKNGLAPQAQNDAEAPRPKITDRVGQEPDANVPQNGAQSGTQGQAEQTAPVAQRVVLYEEDPSDPAGRRYVGSAIWRTETVSPGPGQPPALVVRADVEIPERRMAMTLTLRRNTDQTLPASHTVEIMFNLPADFPFGGISNVPGILMKQAEQTRGAPVAGLAVKVTNGFFLIGLSAVESDLQRNLQLLKERAWFDIPIVYNNGRRAILAVEKGTPGERVFNEAFAAWGQ